MNKFAPAKTDLIMKKEKQGNIETHRATLLFFMFYFLF